MLSRLTMALNRDRPPKKEVLSFGKCTPHRFAFLLSVGAERRFLNKEIA